MSKQKQELNVYKTGYLPWRPSNWIFNIKNFFRTRKWAKQRATRGYADCDFWDLSDYYAAMITKSLRTFAAKVNSYPNEYKSEIEWICELNKLAEKFENITKHTEDEPEVKAAWQKVSDIYDKYRSKIGDTISFDIKKAPGYEEAIKEWRAVGVKEWNKKLEDLRVALDTLYKIWFNLWD